MKFNAAVLVQLCALASICVALGGCTSHARTAAAETKSKVATTGSTTQRLTPVASMLSRSSGTASSTSAGQLAVSNSTIPDSTLVSLTSTPTAPLVPISSALTATAEDCSTADLAITLIHSGAAGGTVGAYLQFTNTSRSTCTLAGWPSVQAVGADEPAREVRPPLVDIGIVPGIPTVHLAPWASALAGITAGDESVIGNRCPPAYHRLSVTPPHQHVAKIISAFAPVVGYLPSCSRMEVTMVVPTDDVTLYS